MAEEKLTLVSLRKQLAQKAQISESEAGNFLEQLFLTITEGLKTDEVVKISGLGSFKKQWIEPRKSVDVNTGSEITIPGYFRIGLSTDNEFKDMINISKEAQLIDPLKKLGEQAEEIKDLLADLNDNPGTEQPTEQPYTSVAPASEEQSITTTTEQPIEEVEAEPKKKKSRPWLIVGITVLIFCILLIIAYLFLQNKIVGWANSLLTPPDTEIYTGNDEDNIYAQENEGTAVIDDTEFTDTDSEAVIGEEKMPSKRVYTEFIDDVTLTEGNRLAWLARKYYIHHEFWVYIYEANQDRITDPNDIEVGTIIRIPKLPDELIKGSNALRQARELEKQYKQM